MGNYHPDQNGRTKGSRSGYARLGRAGLRRFSLYEKYQRSVIIETSMAGKVAISDPVDSRPHDYLFKGK